MCFLVNFVKERIQSELVEKLYKVNECTLSSKEHLILNLALIYRSYVTIFGVVFCDVQNNLQREGNHKILAW